MPTEPEKISVAEPQIGGATVVSGSLFKRVEKSENII
jgi:hypothetical protein